MRKVSLLLFLSLSQLVVSAQKPGTLKPKPNGKPGSTASVIHGYSKDNMEPSTAPCEEFYNFANGGWLKRNPMPETESRWGSFNALEKDNERKLGMIMAGLLRNPKMHKPGSIEQQISTLYTNILDSTQRDKQGTNSIINLLELIQSTDPEGLTQILSTLKRKGYGMLFSFYVSADARKSDVNAVYLSQGGLGLPDRDYYLKTDTTSERTRSAYIDHLVRVLTLAGYESKAKDWAQRVFTIEHRIAEFSMSRTEMRDPDKTYNKINWATFCGQFGRLQFETFRKDIRCPEFTEVIITTPTFFQQLDAELSNWSSEDLRAYLTVHLLRQTGNLLSREFEREMFSFNSTQLSGVKQMKPSAERAIRMVNGLLGEPMGQLYVKEYFSPEAKQYVATMVEELRAVFRSRIQKLEWMSPETRAKALAKLNAFNYKIGYPDQWRSYASVKIVPGDLVRCVENIAEFQLDYMLSKVGKEVDKKEWSMNPQTVNAYYSPNRNEIVFPAGILQPPFFDINAHPALNYGGIGGVIGHEFSHGFDDKGSKYDLNGNLSNWWTAEDRVRFEERTKKIVEQFNRYEPLAGMHINGSLTQGENIADLAGLTLAYYALEKKMKSASKEVRDFKADGFTWQQRFFMGWASVWVNHIREAELRKRLITDPHSPGKYRVLGPLSNLKEFQDAFGCTPDSPMVAPEDTRVIIW